MTGVFQELVGRYSDAGVVHLNSQQSPAAATSDKNSAAGTIIFQRIANKIAQNAFEQDCVAHDYSTGREGAKCKAFVVRQVLVVAANPGQNRRKRDRCRLDVGRMLMQAEGLNEQIQRLV